MPHAVLRPSRRVAQVTGAKEFKFVGAAVLHQDGLSKRQGLRQRRGDRRWRMLQPLSCEIEKDLGIVGVGESLNFVDGRERAVRGNQGAKRGQRFLKPRREDRALLYIAKPGAGRFKVANPRRPGCAVARCADLPLRPIPVSERRRAVGLNWSIPLHAANAAERLAQYLSLVAELSFIRHVLVMAAAATPK